jgi:hypothetical protein
MLRHRLPCERTPLLWHAPTSPDPASGGYDDGAEFHVRFLMQFRCVCKGPALTAQSSEAVIKN